LSQPPIESSGGLFGMIDVITAPQIVPQV